LENKKMKNEIIEEVRRNRAAILESFGGDIGKMMRSLMAKQGSRGQKVVAFTKRERRFASNAYPLREVGPPLEKTAIVKGVGH
jgi:hypothetical protein